MQLAYSASCIYTIYSKHTVVKISWINAESRGHTLDHYNAPVTWIHPCVFHIELSSKLKMPFECNSALSSCSDRLLWQVFQTGTSYWKNHKCQLVWPMLTTYSTLDLGTLVGCKPGWLYRVLAMGPVNLQAVRVWTRWTVQFGCRPIPKPDPLDLGGREPDQYPSTRQVQSPVLHFRLFYLWSHSVILVLIVKYQHWYIIVLFGCTGRLNNQTMESKAHCTILEFSINRVSMIFGPASWVIWVAIGCR